MTLRPSLEGFIRFVRDDMKVPVHAIADDDPTLECCFQSAMELIPHDQGLERLPIIYVRTVYNAAASFLLNFAPGSWFADLRKKLNLGKTGYRACQRGSRPGDIGFDHHQRRAE